MKYVLAGLIFLIFAFTAAASSFVSKIHSIERGKNGAADLLMMENGRTAFLSSSLKRVFYALRANETYEVVLDRNLNVIELTPATPKLKEILPPMGLKGLKDFEPTIVTYAQAQSAFKRMRRDHQNASQCYNRAHIWNLEEFNRTGMQTGKLYLFFTAKYIRNYRYKWWFHVTPIAYVGGTGPGNWRTLDREFSGGALKTKTWTDDFMKNKAVCPVVQKYSHYRNNQYAQDCYLIPTSMYYWQPRDIESFENTGYEKKQFINWEVEHAYWEAF